MKKIPKIKKIYQKTTQTPHNLQITRGLLIQRYKISSLIYLKYNQTMITFNVKDISYDIYFSDSPIPSTDPEFQDVRLFSISIEGDLGTNQIAIKIENSTSFVRRKDVYFQAKVTTDFICKYEKIEDIVENFVLQIFATSHDYLAAIQFVKIKEKYGVARLPQLIPIEFVKERIFPLIANEIQDAQKLPLKERHWKVVFGDNIPVPPSQSKTTL